MRGSLSVYWTIPLVPAFKELVCQDIHPAFFETFSPWELWPDSLVNRQPFCECVHSEFLGRCLTAFIYSLCWRASLCYVKRLSVVCDFGRGSHWITRENEGLVWAAGPIVWHTESEHLIPISCKKRCLMCGVRGEWEERVGSGGFRSRWR